MISYCSSTIVKNNGAEVLSTLTLPWSHSREYHKYGAAQSNPPKTRTENPTVTLNRYGKGRVMYISTPFECDKKSAQQNVFVNHVNYMMDKKAVYSISAPSWIDTMLWEDGDGKYRITLLSAMEVYYECEARDIKIKLNIKGISHAMSAMTGKEIPVTIETDGICITVDSVKDFEMIILS